jgi:phage terminase small subunit
MADQLTGKQKAWADEYIVTLNATEAARRAKYSGDDNQLAVQGHHNLRNPKIMAYVRARLEQHAISPEEIILRLSDIVRGDMGEALNSSGGIDPLEAKRKGKSHLIKRIKIKTITTEESDITETEIELHDSLRAADILAKFYDLTNKVRVESWEDQAIADIKAGKLPFKVLADAFDTDLATKLFEAAGVPISAE